MGIADAILDLVSSGTTLRENNLKEIEGGVVLESQVSKPFSVSDITLLSFYLLGLVVFSSALEQLVLHCAFANCYLTLETKCSSGRTRCKPEIIDTEERCT